MENPLRLSPTRPTEQLKKAHACVMLQEQELEARLSPEPISEAIPVVDVVLTALKTQGIEVIRISLGDAPTIMYRGANGDIHRILFL